MCKPSIMLVWHLHDSVVRTGTTGVVPVCKLVVNWREVFANLSWLCAMSGREFRNVQNFGHDRIMRPGRELCANCSWIRRDNAGLCVRMRTMSRVSRRVHEQLTSSSRVVQDMFMNWCTSQCGRAFSLTRSCVLHALM